MHVTLSPLSESLILKDQGPTWDTKVHIRVLEVRLHRPGHISGYSVDGQNMTLLVSTVKFKNNISIPNAFSVAHDVKELTVLSIE